MLLLAGCGVATTDDVAGRATVSSSQTVSYSGTVQTIDVPANATEVSINAQGGGGGSYGLETSNNSTGAFIQGTLPVSSSEQLLISVGGVGQNSFHTSSKTAGGGWGGLGGDGGDGNSSSDHLRNSPAGGGATTIQLQNGSTLTTVLVAGGGGGGGAGSLAPSGGDAGVDGNGNPSLTGQNGGKDNGGGKGGSAGSEPGPGGGRGGSGSGLGYHGGGGGGGVAGGAGGDGGAAADEGGGGGAGSSSFGILQSPLISTAQNSSNGSVTLTWTFGT